MLRLARLLERAGLTRGGLGRGHTVAYQQCTWWPVTWMFSCDSLRLNGHLWYSMALMTAYFPDQAVGKVQKAKK